MKRMFGILLMLMLAVSVYAGALGADEKTVRVSGENVCYDDIASFTVNRRFVRWSSTEMVGDNRGAVAERGDTLAFGAPRKVCFSGAGAEVQMRSVTL